MTTAIADSEKTAKTRTVRIAINVFIILNLFCLAVYTVLPESPLRTALLPAVCPFLDKTGLRQYFWVFSPDVNTSQAEIYAVISLTDGSKVNWDYPRNSQMGIVEKVFKERYREFYTTILYPENRFLLPDVAAYIATEVNLKNPKNPPLEVSLRVRWKEIPPPASGSSAPPKSGDNEFFRCKVAGSES